MQLRHKFSLIALIYLTSLAINLMLSAWCIVVYFNSAFGEFEMSLAQERLVEQLRRQLGEQLRDLTGPISPADKRRRYTESTSQIEAGLSELRGDTSAGAPEQLRSSLDASYQETKQAAESYLSRMTGQPPSPPDENSFAELDRRLTDLLAVYRGNREREVERAAAIQHQVLCILAISAAVGGILCLVGLLALRKWIVQPIAELRLATRELACGHFQHRVTPRSGDELGRLGEEVNQMSETILEMQRRLVAKERLAASGEMISRLTHNIRNPLAGIRALAEASVRDSPGDQVSGYQNRIIESIDRFERWLHDLQQSVSPVELNVTRIDTASLLGGVAAAVQPMLMRRQVELATEVDPEVGSVEVDPLHFEQAVVALLINAVQASPVGERVVVSAAPSRNHPIEWELTVEDHGAGISPELHEKIFTPYYTTKPDGTGMGLAMARKVVRLHGGDLRVESRVGSGSCFIAALPLARPQTLRRTESPTRLEN